MTISYLYVIRFFLLFVHVADDNDEEESQIVLGELEKIDDDCDRHGIQFVKIDDTKVAQDFGIDTIPAIVYFEKRIPNLYDGNCTAIKSKIPQYTCCFSVLLVSTSVEYST